MLKVDLHEAGNTYMVLDLAFTSVGNLNLTWRRGECRGWWVRLLTLDLVRRLGSALIWG